jgi:hypothetical protein
MSFALLLRKYPDTGFSLLRFSGRDGHAEIRDFCTDYHAVSADIDMENSLISLGTGCGNIGLLKFSSEEDSLLCREINNLFQSTPVKSVCMAGDGRLVSSDLGGNVFVWDIGSNSDAADKLESPDCGISSLVRLGRSHVAGLAETGRLLFWDISRKTIVDDFECPLPQGLSSQIYNCCEGRFLVYPSIDGTLAVYNIQNGSLSLIEAHPDQMFCMAGGDNCIYTIGSQDGLMKRYYGIETGQFQSLSVRQGIVCVSVLDDREFILIDSVGNTGIYNIRGHSLELKHRIDGCLYDTAVTISGDYKRIGAAAAIKDRLKEGIMTNQLEGLESDTKRLRELGFPATSLCLRVWAARKNGDTLRHLCALKDMADSLPQNHSEFDEYLSEYAEILRRTWNIPQAIDIARRLNLFSAEDMGFLEKTAAIISEKTCVFEAEIEIGTIIESASVVGKEFKGFWVMDKKTPLPLRVSITASMIAEKYEQIRKYDTPGSLPRARTISPFWLTADTAVETEMVILPISEDMQHPGVVYGISLGKTEFGSFFTPVVLFNAGNNHDCPDVSKHNRQIAGIYKSLTADKAFCQWPDMLFRAVRDSIQQVNTYLLSMNNNGNYREF